MKIIIAYVSCGSGHFKAAEAIYGYLKEHRPDIETKIIDVLEKANPVFRFFYSRGYSFLVNHLVFIWRLFYWVTYLKPLRPLSRLIGFIVNWLNTRGFADFLAGENADFIVSTHFLSSETASALKNSNKIKSKLMTIITDFGVHPFWINKGTDIYIVASSFTKDKLCLEGIREDCIKELGIPIEPKFFKLHDKDNLSKKIGLLPGEFTVLIVTGSFGIGPVERIVDLLHHDAQLLVVCARNKKLSARLERKHYPNCFVFGFVDNIEEFMAVSDIIITKPGGLSIAESLAMGLLPIFISPIPGQETENLKALLNYGIGFYPKSLSGIKRLVTDFKRHPAKLKKLKEFGNIKKPDATRGICDVICQSGAGPAN